MAEIVFFGVFSIWAVLVCAVVDAWFWEEVDTCKDS
jgi:hypothetical protein